MIHSMVPFVLYIFFPCFVVLFPFAFETMSSYVAGWPHTCSNLAICFNCQEKSCKN